MKFSELTDNYNNKLAGYINNYTKRIDMHMLNHYQKIRKDGQVSIGEKIIGDGYVIPALLKEDLILKLIDHYKEDWDITANGSNYIFKLKDHCLTEIRQKEIEKMVVNDQEKGNRLEILDL